MSKQYRNLVEVCVCGHGKVHHNGKFAECTCDIGHFKNEKICRCSNYQLNIKDSRNQIIMEWNTKVQNQKTRSPIHSTVERK